MVAISFRCRALALAFAFLATAAFAQVGGRTDERTGNMQVGPQQDQMQDRTTGRRVGFTRITNDQVARELDQWIRRDIALKGGQFLIFDPLTSMPLALTFNGVQGTNVTRATQDGGNWTAQVPFTAQDGTARIVYFRLRPAPMVGGQRIDVTAISLTPPEGGTPPTPPPTMTPVETPVTTPVETPMGTPMETPGVTPMETPIEAPTETPMGETGGGM